MSEIPIVLRRRPRSFLMAAKTPLRLMASTKNAHKLLAIYVTVYCHDDEGHINPTQISDATGVSETTVRKCLRALQRLEFVREFTDGTWEIYGDIDADQHQGLKGLVESM